MKSHLILAVGVIILAFGLLFTLQGADVIHWPRESSMIGQRDWIERGIVVVLAGLAIILSARRMRKGP